ncbi:unnamed protein product, partial [Ixodes hexagonus]
ALTQLYHNTELAYADANRYLTSMQCSIEAWDIAWKLLDPSKPVEIQYFGANTLHTKISRHWHELPSHHYEELRAKLLQAIVQYSRGPKLILTKVLVAMASFVIHVIPEFWSDAIPDLLASIHPSVMVNVAPDQVLDLLLELLTVIPEELQARERTSRGPSRSRLEAASGSVLQFLNQLTPRSPFVLRCYSSWSQLGFDNEQHLKFLPRMVQCIEDPGLCRSAAETLTNVATHPDAHRFPGFVMEVVSRIVGLEKTLAESLAHGDTENVASIYSLLLEVGENHSHLLVESLLTRPEHKDSVLKLFRLVLQCSASPGHFPVDESWSRQALGFWYALQDDVGAWEGHQGESLMLALHSLWQALLEAFLRKARLPLDDSTWTDEEKDSLRCYRQDISDSLMYCFNMLRESLLATLAAHMELASRALSRDPAKEWPFAEACVFALQAVADCVGVDHERYLAPLLTEALPALQSHPRVTPTALSCLGAFGSWLQAHPSCIDAVLPMLLAGLESAHTSPAATLALKDISRDCSGALGPHGPRILTASQQALAGGILGSREKVRIMGLVGHVLSTVGQADARPWLSALVGPQLEALRLAAAQELSPEIKAVILQQLRMLAALFCGLSTEETPEVPEGEESPPRVSLVEMVLAEAGVALAALADKYCCDDQVVEALCECIRRGAENLEGSGAVELLAMLVALQSRCAHACVLDASRSLLMLLARSGQPQSNEEAARTALVLLCQCTLDLVVASPQAFQEHTVILEAFFQLMYSIARKLTMLLVSGKMDLFPVFACAVATIALPERTTVKAAACFLAEFILHSRPIPALMDVVNRYGELLVEQVLRASPGGESPRSVLDPMADILLALTKKYFNETCHWATLLIQRPGFPSSQLTLEKKEHYLRLLLKERSNKRRIKEIVSELSLASRGLLGTEYAAQTFNSI